VLGQNGLNAILNYARLRELIDPRGSIVLIRLHSTFNMRVGA
jgi:hypothetical protein